MDFLKETDTLAQTFGMTHGYVAENFPRFARRQVLTRFIARYEIFKLVAPVKGSIVECGVHNGAGLFTWANLAAGLEPVRLHRRIIGFDTFEGFVDVDAKDKGGTENTELHAGGFRGETLEALQASAALYDRNRFLNHIDKVELVQGDATQTIPAYLEANQHLVVSLLWLDFDLYAPTKVALETLVPRMPKGAVICFDEINNTAWPGETAALAETLGIGALELRAFPFDPSIAYAVIG